MTIRNPHALDMVGPDGSKFPVHHKRKCVDAGRAGNCRGCYPHARSHQAMAILAQRLGKRVYRQGKVFSDTQVRAIIEVS